ncbi:MAG: NUDIX domain-containing protein [Bacteroidota bacterium]
MNYQDYLDFGHDRFLPHLSIDLVIIGYEEGKLKCLLLQFGEKWLLPGGYVQKDESVDVAVKRILKERIGLEEPHLKFLSVFGDKDREFSQEFKEFADKVGMEWKEEYWFNNRFVTLAYYSLVHIENTQVDLQELFDSYAWFDFDELPRIWMDHKSIALEARKHLKEDIQQELVVYNLLPEEFTMPELHKLYQAILEKKLDRSRFQKKMLSSGAFERLPMLKNDSRGRNPYQYRLKKNKND